jgi:hypothetical protein
MLIHSRCSGLTFCASDFFSFRYWNGSVAYGFPYQLYHASFASASSEKSPILKNSEKFVENQKNSAEMDLTCKRNRKILELRNSVELTELSAEFADNSAEFFENSSATEYRPV